MNLSKHLSFIKVPVLTVLLMACQTGHYQTVDEFSSLGDLELWLAPNDRLRPAMTDHAYVIGRGDVLQIRVRDHAEFDVDTVVDQKGEMELPLIQEPILLEGLSLDQAAEAVGQWLQPYVRNSVFCRVNLVSTGSRYYYVLDQGMQKFSLGVEPVTLRDLVLPRQDRLDLGKIVILRPDFTDRRRPRFMTLDMSGLDQGYWHVNYRLRANDVIVLNPNLKGWVMNLFSSFSGKEEGEESHAADLEHALARLETRLQRDGGL